LTIIARDLMVKNKTLKATVLVGSFLVFNTSFGQASVEVTGSRIKRVDSESSQPILILNREDIEAQGLTSIGDVIQQISSNGSALNSTYNNGGNGEIRVSLRNLGSNRTLVLVNGRRWVGGTGLGGATDLSTIPAVAVDRIEVLKDGASAIYGSDAIAGVVNIILRNDFNGAEVNAYLGRYRQGDGSKKAADLTVGSSGDRFRALLTIGYVKEEPVMAGSRTISAEPIYLTGTAFGSSTTPFGRFALCKGTWNSATYSCSGSQIRPDGTAGQFTYNDGQSGKNWRAFGSSDFYNFAPENYLVTPQERASIFARGSFDVTKDIQAELQATFNNRKSEQLLAAMPIVLGTGPGAGVIARTVAISKDSIYNPFGMDVVRVQRRAVETGGRSFNQDLTTQAVSATVKGTFDVAGKPMFWETGAASLRNTQADTTYGLFNVTALGYALGPSMIDASGSPICVGKAGDPSTKITNCVPMNLLGARGTITKAMLDYASFVAHDSYGYSQQNLFGIFGGDLAKLPGGPLAFVAGVERRSEKGFDSPDALINSGATTGNARTATTGSFEVKEGFAELAAPIVRDVDLTFATRRSDYSNFGSTTNGKVGARWKLSRQAMLRANWSQGFRAPSVNELYQGVSDSFPQIADPCSTTFGGTYNSLTPEQKARCHSQGVPVGGYDQGNPQIRISTGGNANLRPETSLSKTLGLVVSPEMIPGFDISLDFWRINVRDTIGDVSARTILTECINNGDADYCSLFRRNPQGQITYLLSAGLNIGNVAVKGYDITANYRLPTKDFGTFRFTLDTSVMQKYSVDGGENLVGSYYDRYNYWRVRTNFITRWTNGNYGVTLFTRYYSAQTEDCSFLVGFSSTPLCSNEKDGTNRLGAKLYNDMSAFLQTPGKGRITIGMNNIFNTAPPVAFSTFANSFDPQYEIPGRFMYARYSQRF